MDNNATIVHLTKDELDLASPDQLSNHILKIVSHRDDAYLHTSYIVDILRSYDVFINAQDDDDLSILHHAVDSGLLEVVKTLLELGANTEIHGEVGDRPIHYATSSSKVSVDMIKILLEAGCDVNAKNSDQMTPLFLACLPPITDDAQCLIIEMLLKAGADPNAEDLLGWTPLHNAALALQKNQNDQNQFCAIEILLRFGASKDVKIPATGATPYDIAWMYSGQSVEFLKPDRF